MYVFLADLPDGVHLETLADTLEGILDWKSIDWILDKDNMGVVSNLSYYLSDVLEGIYDREHTFNYVNDQIQTYQKSDLAENEGKRKYIQI